ncbi:MAG TPA: hypothetical protein VGX68_04510 [Thermoanaerobaculia bacterium]|jgi:hypothetical protein|nr:hypothetical protein [Thermoanaerobaculia bacterium]
MISESPQLAAVAFAKSAAHERFVQSFEGKTKGRYAIAYLAAAGVLGGPALVESIKWDLGNKVFLPEEMYPGRDVALICDRAARAGLSMARLGEQIIPSRLRANPEMFQGKTILEAFQVLEQASQNDTTYYANQTWPPPQIEPGRALLYRPGRPTPCETFVGILHGYLKAFGVQGSAREVACIWEGSPYCTFEVRWGE